ncbi:MAG: PAS domain S-box protein [Gammaproteobacteria bacterium]
MASSNFLIFLIMSISVVAQFSAAVMAIGLIKVSGRRLAWGLISTALVLMTIRRGLPLYRLVTAAPSFPPDPSNEIVGLVLSIAMLVGIARLTPLFYDRIKKEESLSRLNRELHAISSCHQILMRTKDEQALLTGICRTICDEAGYRMAWVGYVDHGPAKNIRPMAWGGNEDDYLKNADISWADTERGRGPGGIAVRTGKTSYIQDFSTDARVNPWRLHAIQRGYRSNIALPLMDDNAETFGILCIYSSLPNAFTSTEIRLLEELAGDLAFGITAQRAREERNRTEAIRKQMTAIVEFSNDAIIVKNAYGIISHWNKSAERIFGYRAEEIIGQHCAALAAPEHRDEIHDLLEKIRNGEIVVNHETQRIRKDGNLIYVAMTLSPIRDSQGRITGISAIERDITKQKLAEEQLRRSEHGLAEAQRIAHLGNWELDLEDNVLTWSDEIFRIFEIDPTEFGASYEAFLAHIHPDDRKMVNTAYRDSVENKKPYDIVHRLLMNDGRIKYVNEKCETYYDETGRAIRSTGTVHDITERHRAELELAQLSLQHRLILDSAGEGIYGLDTEGRCTFVNPAARRLLGFSAEEFIDHHSHTLFHHTTSDGHPYLIENCPVQAAYKYGQINRGIDFYWRKDGSSFPVEFISTPIVENGATIGAVVMFNDITERRHAEDELRRYKDHLEEEVQQRTADLVLARNAAEAANQAKSVFLANMSHELRTPLNAILGFSTMLRDDPLLSDQQRQNIDIINRSGSHLLTLINDVLEMSKIEAGRVQLEHAPFDLGGMVRDVIDMMQIRAVEKGLRLIVDQDSRFPRYIVGDEARLRQILINLLGNAVKFTRQGGVTLRLGTQKNRISHLRIEVEDSGPGISAEDQSRIFEPFIQLGDQGANKGTGLGLSISRQFVEMMGGHIGLESTPGKGSMFRIELPLEEAAEKDIVQQAPLEKGSVIGLIPGQAKFRILIAEDQRDNQLLLSQLMETIGIQVNLAENGEQAVQLFSSWRPHLIWMDRRMPVMDGIEATQKIRALPGGNDVKIVAVTASAFSEQRREMINAGMDDFVRKPFRSSEIYECLAKQLGVQYVYDNSNKLTPTANALTNEMLAVLPEELRADLKDALQKLDSERIGQIIRQVANYDKALERTLNRYADNFDYPAILNTLRTPNKSHES